MPIEGALDNYQSKDNSGARHLRLPEMSSNYRFRRGRSRHSGVCED